jgi:hypothetical protein
MTFDQANLLWIRAHVMLHARCPDSYAWREEDLIAAFAALPAGAVVPFAVWAARAYISLDDAAGTIPADEPPPPAPPRSEPPDARTIREQCRATFGAVVPLYDPRAKGPLQWP